jgi:HD-GYP domain-containing protein (c-di-GMP phosphodiesterase class II)
MEALKFYGHFSLSQRARMKLENLWNRFSTLRNGECGEHAREVARVSCLIGKDLGINDQDLAVLSIAAFFHDIGKLSICESVLSKPSKLNEFEYRHIQTHVKIALFILSQITEFKRLAITKIVSFHHESINGKGYPFGIRGSEIPIEAKILAVADVYDAISAKRSYNIKGSSGMAIWELKKKCGEKFEPAVVNSFLSLCEKGII